MNKKLLTILLAFSSVLLCHAERHYFVQSLLRPADITFPADVQNVLVVNNSAVQAAGTGHTVNGEKARIDTDSASIYCTWGMTEALNETGFFESVTLLDATQHPNPQQHASIVPLTPARIDSICRLYGVDALIVLNNITEKDILSRQLFYPDEYETSVACHITLDVLTRSQWTVCYPQNDIQTPFNSNDSIYWQAEGGGETQARIRETEKKMPDTRQAIYSAALNAGIRAALKLTPQWDKEDRYLFDDNKKNFGTGLQHVLHRQWKEAISAWQPMLNHKKPLTKAYAYANIAVCSEMDNDLESALSNAQTAKQLLENINKSEADIAYDIISYYIEQLTRIIEDEPRLKKQLATE